MPYAAIITIIFGGIMKKMVAVLALGTIALTGCGGSVHASSSTPTTVAAATPTPTPEPTATAKQFASALAEYDASWRGYEQDIVSCAMDKVVNEGTAAQIHASTCGVNTATVTLQAQIVTKEFLKLPKPVPEVKDLVDRTLAALSGLGKTGADKACADFNSYKTAACDAAETETNGAIRPVISVLDAWKPYMGG